MKRALEERLSGLALRPPETLTARVLAGSAVSTASRPRAHLRLRMARGLAVAALVVAGNGLVAIVVPGYGRLLAQTTGLAQVAEALLSRSGLSGGDVAPVGGAARSAGHEVRVLGAYADSTRTVVLVDVDGRGTFNPGAPDSVPAGPVVEVATLLDSEGREYRPQLYSWPNGYSVPMPFEPVLATQPGETVHLTLHVSRLMGKAGTAINGDWRIPFEVTVAASKDLTVPQSTIVDGNEFVFTSETLSGQLLTLRWQVTGPTIDEMRALAYSPPGDNASVQERLVALSQSLMMRFKRADGGPVATVGSSGGALPHDGPMTADLIAVVPGPGEYELTLLGSGEVVTTVTVP